MRGHSVFCFLNTKQYLLIIMNILVSSKKLGIIQASFLHHRYAKNKLMHISYANASLRLVA